MNTEFSDTSSDVSSENSYEDISSDIDSIISSDEFSDISSDSETYSDTDNDIIEGGQDEQICKYIDQISFYTKRHRNKKKEKNKPLQGGLEYDYDLEYLINYINN